MSIATYLPTPLKKYALEIKHTLITMMLLSSLVLLTQVDALNAFNHGMDSIMNTMTRLGFVGMFLLGAAANCSFLVQIPYTIPLFSLALNGSSLSSLYFMAVGAGIGAGTGKIIAYRIANQLITSQEDITKGKIFGWINRTIQKYPRSAPLLILALTATPLPDDLITLPLALAGYEVRRIIVPLIIGKIVHNLIIATLFYYGAWLPQGSAAGDYRTGISLGILIVFGMIIYHQAQKANHLKTTQNT